MDCGLCYRNNEHALDVESAPSGSGSCRTCHDGIDHEENGPRFLGSSRAYHVGPALAVRPHDFSQTNVSQQTNSSLLPSCDFLTLIGQRCQLGACD